MSLRGQASTEGQPIASGSVSPSQSMVAVACRDHVEIFKMGIGDGSILKHESINLSHQEGNFTVTDVSWSPHDSDLVAGSATNGQIAVLRVDTRKDKEQTHIALKWEAREDSKRAVNRVNWHPSHRSILISASHNSNVRLWDIRSKAVEPCIATYNPRTEACRDVQMCPTNENLLAAVFENGNLAVWDQRFPDAALNQITAHTGVALSVKWCPTVPGMLATGGRDKTVKIWDMNKVQERERL